MKKLREFIRTNIICLWKMLKYKRLGQEIPYDSKHKFEKDIMKVLKKYKIHDNKYQCLQYINIILDVHELPVVKMNTIVVEIQGKD